MLDLKEIVIPPIDSSAEDAARRRQNRLTKPMGSLGRLEDLSIRIAAMTGVCPPAAPDPAVIFVFAADHGVARRGVSAYPPEVTAQMVLNYAGGGAVINCLAKQMDAKLTVTDVGVDYDFPSDLPINHRKVRKGTRDWSTEAAMTAEETLRAIEVGWDIVMAEPSLGLTIVGEMGIGNTATAAALASALLGIPAADITGRGTGLDGEALAKKKQIVAEAVARLTAKLSCSPLPEGEREVGSRFVDSSVACFGSEKHVNSAVFSFPSRFGRGGEERAGVGSDSLPFREGVGVGSDSLPFREGEGVGSDSPLEEGAGEVCSALDILSAVGGLEIASMAGAIIASASRRVPVLIDGFISSCAALVADRLAPGVPHYRGGVRDYLIASHRSHEAGHSAILDALGQHPLLDLGMRLGEGSGAALAIPIVRAAVNILANVATFDEAGVSDREATTSPTTSSRGELER